MAIPPRAMEVLGVAPGDTLDLTFDSGGITLRPTPQDVPLVKEKGVWISRGDAPLSQEDADEAVELIRGQRIFRHD